MQLASHSSTSLWLLHGLGSTATQTFNASCLFSAGRASSQMFDFWLLFQNVEIGRQKDDISSNKVANGGIKFHNRGIRGARGRGGATRASVLEGLL